MSEQYLAYIDGERAVLVRQRWRQLQHVPERHGWHTEEHVFVSGDQHVRGTKRMYPYLPDVESINIDRETFDEAVRLTFVQRKC